MGLCGERKLGRSDHGERERGVGAGEFTRHAAGWQGERAGTSAYALDSVRFESAQLAGGLRPKWALAAAGKRRGLRAILAGRRRQAERIEISSCCGGPPALTQAGAGRGR